MQTSVSTVQINGETYSVRLVEADNKSDKTEAVTAAQASSALAPLWVLAPMAQAYPSRRRHLRRHKIPAIGASAPTRRYLRQRLHSACASRSVPGTVMANYAWQEGQKSRGHHPARRRLLFRSRQLLQQGVHRAWWKVVRNSASRPIHRFQIDLDQHQSRESRRHLRTILHRHSPLIIKQARELGITAKIMAGDTWENSSIIENAGTSAEAWSFPLLRRCRPAMPKPPSSQGFQAFLVENKQPDIITPSPRWLRCYITASKPSKWPTAPKALTSATLWSRSSLKG